MNIRSIAFGAVIAAMSVSTAQAAIVADSDICGELPNSKWSWQVTQGDPILTGGESVVGDPTVETRVAGNNTFAVETITTTISPTLSTATTICTALNPQGKINLDHSTVVPGPTTVLSEGSTSTSTTQTRVCGPNLEPC